MKTADILRKRKRINYTLGIICLILLVIISVTLYKDNQVLLNQQAFSIPKPVTKIEVINKNTNIVMQKNNNNWSVEKPYKYKASKVAIKTITGYLSNRCQLIENDKKVKTSNKNKIIINGNIYEFGIINNISDMVYVRNGTRLALCDKILNSIVFAPVSSFLDRSLYDDKLLSISSKLGGINDKKIIKNINLSVLEMVETSSVKKDDLLGFLEFKTSVNSYKYQIIRSSKKANKKEYISLYKKSSNPKIPSFIFVIKNNKYLNEILLKNNY